MTLMRLFWGDKFQACLDHCAPDDIMLVIHADCHCASWPKVIEHCRSAFNRVNNIGIWSPRLTGSPWRLIMTRMYRLKGTSYSVVAHTDGLVFALAPELQARMRQADYSPNLYGLGIDWMLLCSAYARGRVAIVDESILVRHPMARGYTTRDAQSQERDFLTQMTPEEHAQHDRLKAIMKSRKRHAKILHKLEGFQQRLTRRWFGRNWL
jgi:hypothetical protein